MSKQNLKYVAALAGLAAVGLILFGLFAVHDGATGQTRFGKDELTIVSQGGARHHFKIEVAEKPTELALGLMYRDHLDPDRGMLFIYPTVDAAAMWMHNTQIALDMLFIDASNKVVRIAANARPFDDRQIPSGGPVKAALEINAGKAAELGIREGDRVENARLEKAAKP